MTRATNDEVPDWVTVDSANAVYVAGVGGPSPNVGNVSFLKPVTLKYDSAGTPLWATFNGGDIQVTVDDLAGGSVFTLYRGQMTSARFEQTGISDPVPATPAQLTATGDFNGAEFRMALAWTDNASNEFWYAIERCAGAGCSNFAEIGRTTGENASGFQDGPLTSGATFTYRVRAVGFTGNSGYSNTATGTTSASRACGAVGGRRRLGQLRAAHLD
jgi:predicted phage tail protein